MGRQATVGDRRVARTRERLHGALASLIHEKDCDAISVTEVLDRTDVGRSTFYMHFADKDQLLASCMRDVFAPVRPPPPAASLPTHDYMIGFSLPILEHVHRHCTQREGDADAGMQATLHRQLQEVLAEHIGPLASALQPRSGARALIPNALLARHLASTFALVLDWWLTSPKPLTPSEVNQVFRALVLPVLAPA